MSILVRTGNRVSPKNRGKFGRNSGELPALMATHLRAAGQRNDIAKETGETRDRVSTAREPEAR